MTKRICPTCGVRDADTQSYCLECSREYKRARRAAKVAASPSRDCSECGMEFRSPYPHTVTCSPECRRVRERRLVGKTPLPANPLSCATCGAEFMARNSTHRFCSKGCTMIAHGKWSGNPRIPLTDLQRAENHRASQARWELANPERSKYRPSTPAKRASVLRRRARRESVMTLPFTADELRGKFDYWGARCWMCKGSATSVDHVKPIAANGPHILANLRPACGSCNSAKGGRWYGVLELRRFIKS